MEGFDFTKASDDQRLIQIRNNLVRFVVSCVVADEIFINDIIKSKYPDRHVSLMCEENKTIYDLISSATESYFNSLWKEVMTGTNNDACNFVRELSSNYGISHYAVIKSAFKIKFKSHVDIDRTKISVDNKANLKYTLLNQLNVYFQNNVNQVIEMIDLSKENPSQEKVFQLKYLEQ